MASLMMTETLCWFKK